MLADRYGLDLTTSSSAARDAYVAGCDGVLAAAGNEIADLTRAVEQDPNFALGHVALGRAQFLVANVAEARKAVARARELAPGTTAREQSHINALCLGMEGKPVEALAATRAHLAAHPRDAMVAAPATGVFGLIGFSGRTGREPEQVEFLEVLRPHLADDWWFQMVYAFGLEEIGRLAEAQVQIERSMAANPRSAHGAHIKAHVLYEMGEDRAALAYLRQWMPAYPRDGLMHCHISWHVAMFALTLGEVDEAWRVYQQQVHPGGSWGPFINTTTDAVAFLWRAELAGQQRRPQLWSEVRDYVLRFFPKAGLAFADVHCALACIASGDTASLARIVQELQERVASGRYPAGSVVPQLVSGFAAYEKGAWREAIGIFETALAETVRIGGSRAQRDLAEHTLVAAYLKDGRLAQARKLIAARADRHPSVPVAGLAA
ncbi:MAG: tetratricopeptide repeat protein [Alphaproteobacteria bacterium]|nr:tetratricopeptide repeat protein [Alphaproteobacteria bacterium]